MARKPITLSINKDSISITFNSEGWNPIHTKMLEAYARRFAEDGSIKGLTPAELLGKALDLECLNRDGQESFRRWYDMLEIDIAQDQIFKSSEPQ